MRIIVYFCKYPAIYLDTTDFITRYHDERIVAHIESELKQDILEAYPDVKVDESADLMNTLIRIFEHTGEPFIFIIDEWDAILRENSLTPAPLPKRGEYILFPLKIQGA